MIGEKKDVVIFGTADTAQLAKFYLENDSEYNPVAFTVHEAFLKDPRFEGLPVVPFGQLQSFFPSSSNLLFAPMTGASMSDIRKKVYLQGKEMGYEFISYISSRATNLAASIGENCFILEDNTLQPFVEVGNNVVMWSGNHIGHHSIIRDHAFFTSHVVLSGHCDVGEQSWFGVNATIRDFSIIPKGTLISMGACLTKNPEEEWGVYIGVPAKPLKGKDARKVLK